MTPANPEQEPLPLTPVQNPDPWGVKRVENLITGLTGVLSARVVVTPLGEVSEVHVLTRSDIQPKQVVRNIESALFWTQEGRPGMHFTWLLHGIEQMMLTGKPSWNVERTLLTSGALDALLLSLNEGQRRVETPYLMLRYPPIWHWMEPPPPPPLRPWAGE